jgi:putative glycerol-1-phosphate prenyltransferase
MNIYETITGKIKQKKKQFAVLIDPDKTTREKLTTIIQKAVENKVDYFFIGGSLLTDNSFEDNILQIKQSCDIPVVIFPGNSMQISNNADAILFLSLISGRNPEMLIGKHVIAAPYLKKSTLDIIPTGYMIIDSGKPTTALYMSNSIPIPSDKADIAMCTAMAGEMLGLKIIYMDAGSGAGKIIPEVMITKVRNSISLPLIIGGGIRTAEQAISCFNAGADMIVVGNAIEENNTLIEKIAQAIR